MPPDMEMTPLSRTIGTDQLVDEMVASFTHTLDVREVLAVHPRCALVGTPSQGGPTRDDDPHAERAARKALAISAVARVDQLRRFADLIPDLAALAAASLG